MAQPVCQRINPEFPIPIAATAVHGITDQHVADCPTFFQFAPVVQEIVQDAVLVGYCSRTFDTIMLDQELRRAGQPGLPHDSAGRIIAPEIDLFQLWIRHEDRKLTTAARRFAGVELAERAHTADADAFVLPAVLDGLCAQFGLDAADIERLCALSIPDGAVDRDGKFVKNADGVVCFNFGPKKGEPAQSDPGLLEWMLKKDFSPETKAVAHALYRHAMRRSA
jgi:DNA polymerase-3 subunit epsilon